MLKTSFIIFSLVLACTACGEVAKPVTDGGITFNQQAASKLTPEQLKKMDIEFFNYLDVKGGFGVNKAEQIKDRTNRMIKLAEAGFEPAWLALRLYDFADYGQPRFSKDYATYWHKLKALADSGNASAQCLFDVVAREYANMNDEYRKKGFDMPDLPTQETKETLNKYTDAAVKQGQTHCQNYAAGEAREKGDLEIVRNIKRNCALAGDARCESYMGSSYAQGYEGFPKDSAKSLCWYKRAYAHNQSHDADTGIIMQENDLLFKVGSNAKRDLLLSTLTPETDCEAARFDWTLLKQQGE